MNDQRPTRPCSADSSRNAGPSPRSLRNAEIGVSQSSTNVWRNGMRLCSRASSRTSSSEGVTCTAGAGGASEAAIGSAAARVEHALGVGEAQTAAAQQDGEVVDDVGGLVRDALVGLLAHRAHDLLGLLLHLLAGELGICEQRGGVGGVGVGGSGALL